MLRYEKLTFLIGERKILEELLEETVPRAPFDSETIEFLRVWSEKIKALPANKKDGQMAAFGFWIRTANLQAMKSGYDDITAEGFTGEGLCLQFVPSNVPALFAYSLTAGILAGNAVVMRVSSREGSVSEGLIDALKETLEEIPVWKGRIVLLKYEHDREITDALSVKCNVRVIWGGDASVAEIQKSPIRPSARDITFPDRKSMAVIDAEAVLAEQNLEGAVRNFYNDTYLNDQNACSSPGFICWLGEKERAAMASDRFFGELSEFLEGRYQLQPQMSVRKIEQAMYLAAIGMANRIIPGLKDCTGNEPDTCTDSNTDTNKALYSCAGELASHKKQYEHPASLAGCDNTVTRVLTDKPDPELWEQLIPGGFFIEYMPGVTADELLDSPATGSDSSETGTYVIGSEPEIGANTNSLAAITPMLTDKCQTISVFGVEEDTVRAFAERAAQAAAETNVQAAAEQATQESANTTSPARHFRVVPMGRTMDFDLCWDGHDLVREMCRKAPVEHIIERNGCGLAVKVQGEGPVLILIHGVACDRDFFAETAKLLEKDFTVITYDRRGYSRSRYIDGYTRGTADEPSGGASKQSTDGYTAETADGFTAGTANGSEQNPELASVAEQAQDAREILLRFLKPGEKAIVAGCSAGGIISLELTARYPELVSSLFLYEAAYAVKDETLDGLEDWKEQLKEAAERNLLAKSMLLFINTIGPRDEKATEKPAKVFERNIQNLERFLKVEIDSMLGYSKTHRDIYPEVPCICGAGTFDSETMFYRMMEDASGKWACTLSRLEGCHNLAEDRPDTFAAWIRENVNK